MTSEGNGTRNVHREEAERIFRAVGVSVAKGPGTNDMTGALVGVGEALLAIHDELQFLRLTVEPDGGQFARARVTSIHGA